MNTYLFLSKCTCSNVFLSFFFSYCLFVFIIIFFFSLLYLHFKSSSSSFFLSDCIYIYESLSREYHIHLLDAICFANEINMVCYDISLKTIHSASSSFCIMRDEEAKQNGK